MVFILSKISNVVWTYKIQIYIKHLFFGAFLNTPFVNILHELWLEGLFLCKPFLIASQYKYPMIKRTEFTIHWLPSPADYASCESDEELILFHGCSSGNLIPLDLLPVKYFNYTYICSWIYRIKQGMLHNISQK